MDSLCRLDELVAAVNEKSGSIKNASLPYLGLEHIGQHGAGLVGQAESAQSISTNSIFKQRDVLFGKLRPNLRKCLLAPFDGYCSTDVLVLRPNGEVDPRFAARVFQADRVGAEAERTAAGTKMPRTSWNELRALKVFCPDLQSQERIADVIDTLDTTISQTEAIIEKLKQVKQGLLHDLLTRGIDDNGELRPPQSQAPHLYKDSPLGWIPRAWTARPLAEIVATTPNAIVDGPFGSNLKSEHYRSSGIPVIQSGYVTSGEFRAESYVYVTLQHFQTQARSRVDPGDIVMAKIGANAGMCAVLPTRHAFGILAGNCMKITADDCVVRRDWLVHYLHRLYQVTGMSDVRTETAQPAISLGRIRKLLVPVPPNVEQERAALSLASIEESLRTEAKAASKMRELKSGLMDDLLTGRVRVTPPLA